MKAITEKDQDHKQWYEEAGKQTLESLPSFLSHIMEDYQHDYGTICHALAAGGIATMWAMNKEKQGGITGFQSGAVMWEFIRNWNKTHNKTGLRLVDYDNFLYPQYAAEYEKTISPHVWDSIKKEAKQKIDTAIREFGEYLQKLDKYNVDIEAFITKYPDYNDNRAKYDRIGCGTSDQWEAQAKKEKEGFEFAPEQPYAPITDESPVYKHWESIVAGKIPFGYRVKND